MTAVTVVGGIYGEECAFPLKKEVFGSAGRAAVALSGQINSVALHSLLPPEAEARAKPIFDAYGVDMELHGGEQFISFDYLHCLAEPQVHPNIVNIAEQPAFEVNGDLVVQFGMMECSPIVHAEICVYDPQSPTTPAWFGASGSTAKRLAFVANAGEVELLTGKGLDEGARTILQSEGAEVVVAKCGLHGARIYTSDKPVEVVPAYQVKSVYTVGSGDIFVAAFAFAWGDQCMSPADAADYASRAVAGYVETGERELPEISLTMRTEREPVQVSAGKVYLAGPFRELGQRVMINEARKVLLELGMDVFSPVHDIGRGPAEAVVEKDLSAIADCDVMLAILNGSSPGTLFEVGYAVALRKPVYCVAQNMRAADAKLPAGSGCLVHEDLISALHLLSWRG